MGESEESSKWVPGRVSRPGLIVGAAVVGVAALVASFLVGRSIPPSPLDSIEAASGTIPVYAPVEQQIVDPRTSFTGSVAAAVSVPVTSTVVQHGVVTRQPNAPGDAVAAGQLLGMIEGQPIFALPTPLASYRDLVMGDTGDDVALLQAALAAAGDDVPQNGTVDAATFDAVAAMYAAVGLDRPSSIPLSAFVGIEGLPVTINSVAGVGETVSGDAPLATIEVAPQHVEFRADPATVALLEVGTQLDVSIGTETFSGIVFEIGDFTEGDGLPPGRVVSLEITDERFATIPAGMTATVAGPGVATDGLAVPLAAVRHDAGSDYVLVEEGEGEDRRVDITVLVIGGGWAAIEGALEVGDRVRLS